MQAVGFRRVAGLSVLPLYGSAHRHFPGTYFFRRGQTAHIDIRFMPESVFKTRLFIQIFLEHLLPRWVGGFLRKLR